MKARVFHLDPFMSTLFVRRIDLGVKRIPNQSFLKILTLCFTLLMASSKLMGTAGNPCDCTSFTNIGSIGNTTYLGSPSLSGCVRMMGTIVINDNITFDNLSIRMVEGSQIRVEAQLTMVNSFLSGCTFLWKGIRVVENYGIDMRGNIIKDAQYGVFLENNTFIRCDYNKFQENFIGIAIGDPYLKFQKDITIYQREPIIGNEFTCYTILPDPYPTHPEYPYWPTDASIPYNKTFAAAYISGATGFDIGIVNPTTPQRNLVDETRNGFIINNSATNIFGTTIQNLEGEISRPLGTLAKNQYGIYAETSKITVGKNIFDALKTGVSTKYCDLSLYNNTLTMVNQNHAIYGKTYGVEAESPTACNIKNNVVTDAFTGIRLITGWVPFIVYHNTITNDVSDRNIIGIEVDVWKIALPDKGVIDDNTITIESGHNAYGIKANIAGSLDITLNDIAFTGEDLSLNDNSGIALEEVYVSTVSKNTVTGGANCMVDDDNAGIRLVNSCDNVVFCNQLTDMDYGLDITAMCNFNRLTAQVIDDHNYGLLLNAPTYLGTQDHNGNRWIGTYGVIGAFIRGDNTPDEVETAERSVFRVDPSDGLSGELDPVYGPASVDDIWFKPEPGITKTCAAIPDIVVDDELYENLILDTLEYETYNDQMTWMAKAHAFTQIIHFPDLRENAVLDSFYDVERLEPLGQLMIVAAKLNQQYFPWVEDKAGRQVAINALLEDLAEIDSLLATNPSDSLDQYDIRDEIVEELADSLALWLEDDSTSLLTRISTLQGIQDDLSEITPSNDIETNLLLAIDLQICHWLDSTISNTLKGDLLTVASKCVWEGGPGVFFAQSLYSTLKDTVFDYNSLPCEEIEFRSDNREISNDLVSVNPNPGTGFYTIEVNTKKKGKVSYALSNAQGQFILKTDLSSKNEVLDLTGFPSGMYILSVLNDEEVIGVERIIHQQ